MKYVGTLSTVMKISLLLNVRLFAAVEASHVEICIAHDDGNYFPVN